MSDYMFMLESHLSPGQSRALAAVEQAAREAGAPLFLTGGAMRDMLGGFPITDLDFAVQGNAITLARQVAQAAGAEIISLDETRKTAELRFPDGVTVEIGMARTERYSKPGARPQVEPAPIHQDLLRRDFTINSIALSLHPASRGLLLDPTNGLGDLHNRELRANSNVCLFDDPVRLLRLVRLRVRLGFEIEARTRQQYESARSAGIENSISPRSLLAELRQIAREPNAAEVVGALEKEGLLTLFSPALAGPRLNASALAKLQKARQLVPFGVPLAFDSLAVFLALLTEKLSGKEKAELAKRLQMSRAEADSWQELEARTRALEKKLKSGKLNRPSLVYELLSQAPGEQVLFLYVHSKDRLVHDRIRNYLTKYLPAAQEITDKDVAAAGFEPGSARFARVKREMIAARLDGRIWRPEGAAKERFKRPRTREATGSPIPNGGAAGPLGARSLA
jgi:tRNA nucleotidyltransferase (CCA-adding enzyme)